MENHLLELGLNIGLASSAGFIDFLSDRFCVHALYLVIGADLPSGLILKLKEWSRSDQYLDIIAFLYDFSLFS